MYANGYVNILGISVDTRMTINNNHFAFDVQGNMLGLFTANLHIALLLYMEMLTMQPSKCEDPSPITCMVLLKMK